MCNARQNAIDAWHDLLVAATCAMKAAAASAAVNAVAMPART
jgi:hypothetical protein